MRVRSPLVIVCIASLCLALSLVACSLAAAQEGFSTSAAGGPHVIVNGQVLQAPAQLVGDHTLVPMRAVFEALQADVKWFPAAQQITATRGGVVVQMWIGRQVAIVNDREIPLGVAPMLIGDMTYVPLRFPAETFGGDVKWNSALMTATITIAPVVAVAPPTVETPTPTPAPTPTPTPVVETPQPPVVVTPPTPLPPYQPPTTGYLPPGVVPARPGTNGVYVELCHPQSDDQGHYIGTVDSEAISVIGAVTAPRGVTQVSVNGVPASLSATSLRPFGAPRGAQPLNFMAPVDVDPYTSLFVTVTDGSGLQTSLVFVPDRNAAMARLGYLRDQARAAQLRREIAESEYQWWELRMANAYCAYGRYGDAIPVYRRFIEVEPALAIGPFFFGIALCEHQDYDLAFVQYRRVMEIEPGFYFVHYQMGYTYERCHRYDDAIVEYRRVTFERPECMAAHWRLGVALSFGGHHDEAVMELQRVSTGAPHFGEGHHSLGLAFAAQGRWDAASAQYSVALGLTPRNAELHNHMGDALSHQHKYDAAADQYRQVLRINPQHTEAHQGLVQTTVNGGHYDQAWTHVHEAQKAGVKVSPEVLKDLQSKMPEPKDKGPVDTSKTPHKRDK